MAEPLCASCTGPYKLKDVAINTWAHNAAPIALHDGTFAIVHIGTGTGPANGGQDCNKSASDVPPFMTFQNYDARASSPAFERQQAQNAADGGSTIHVSSSLDGPWKPLSPNTLGGCNNPAPWVHPNGTIYIVCGNAFKRAASISGPWTTVSTFSHSGGESSPN
jgi:hypothetical protein